jgi:hypothetical protein
MIIEKPRHNHSAGAMAKNSLTEGQAAPHVLRPRYGCSLGQYHNTVATQYGMLRGFRFPEGG